MIEMHSMFKQGSIVCCSKVNKWLMYTGDEYIKLEVYPTSNEKEKKNHRWNHIISYTRRVVCAH